MNGYYCDPSCLKWVGRCLFITENLLELFSLTQVPVPQRKYWSSEEDPTCHEQIHRPTHTLRHTHHELTDMYTQHTAPLATNFLLLRSPPSLSSWGRTLPPFDCYSLG